MITDETHDLIYRDYFTMIAEPDTPMLSKEKAPRRKLRKILFCVGMMKADRVVIINWAMRNANIALSDYLVRDAGDRWLKGSPFYMIWI